MNGDMVVVGFAGGGGSSVGIAQALGRDPDVAINHDEVAVAMHEANHPRTRHYCQNIWRAHPFDVVGHRRVGLAWFSPDCFPASTMVLTATGYRPIESIEIGDMVLTHRMRWRRVTQLHRSRKPLLEIRGHGHPGLRISGEHPIYARRRRMRHRGWTLDDAEWLSAQEADKGWYWATPTKVDALPIPQMEPRSRKATSVPVDTRLMWLAGRYLGDGWTRLTETRAELVIICGKHEADALGGLLDLWPRAGRRVRAGELAWQHRELKTAVQFTTNCRALVEWLRREFGHGAAHKRVPGWALGMSDSLRQALLEGYLSADGWSGPDAKAKALTECTTVSPALAWGIRSLAATLGHAVAVYRSTPAVGVIEGRKVTTRPAMRLRWRDEVENDHRQTRAEADLRWAPIRERKDLGVETDVYNIAVEGDESYVVEGIVVHNCRHFSKAKGAKPVSKQIRDLAWVVVAWAKTVRPAVIIIENVVEFRTWGPLLADNRPCPERAGADYERWRRELRRQGYRGEARDLRARDYGAPTIRCRHYEIWRCDGAPIVWPEPTHGAPDSPDVLAGRKLPWRTAAEIIDWTIPCPSIFLSREEGRLQGCKRPLVDATLRRLARGTMRYVVDAEAPYIVPGMTPAVANDRSGQVAAWLAQHNTGVTGHDAREPLSTILQTGSHQAVVTAHISRQFGASVGHAADVPLATVTAGGGGKSALVTAWLAKFYGSAVGQPANDALHSVTTLDRFGLVTVTVAGEPYVLVDVGMRMLQPPELFRGNGFPPGYKIDVMVNGRPISRRQQIRCAGNSVCPPVAKALVQANVAAATMALTA